MKVEVKDRRGVVKSMDDRYARILSKLGHVTYLTSEMRAAQPTVQIEAAVVVPPTAVQAPSVKAQAAEAPAAPVKRKYVRKAKAKE